MALILIVTGNSAKDVHSGGVMVSSNVGEEQDVLGDGGSEDLLGIVSTELRRSGSKRWCLVSGHEVMRSPCHFDSILRRVPDHIRALSTHTHTYMFGTNICFPQLPKKQKKRNALSKTELPATRAFEACSPLAPCKNMNQQTFHKTFPARNKT